MAISAPIVRKIDDNRNALNAFEQQISQDKSEKTRNVLLSFPTVYVHNHKTTSDYEVYVGESNNILQRTRQHLDETATPTLGKENFANRRFELLQF